MVVPSVGSSAGAFSGTAVDMVDDNSLFPLVIPPSSTPGIVASFESTCVCVVSSSAVVVVAATEVLLVVVVAVVAGVVVGSTLPLSLIRESEALKKRLHLVPLPRRHLGKTTVICFIHCLLPTRKYLMPVPLISDSPHNVPFFCCPLEPSRVSIYQRRDEFVRTSLLLHIAILFTSYHTI